MVDWMHCLKNLLLFDIPLLYCYINLRSSITFYLSSGDTCLSLDISLLSSFVLVSEYFCSEVFETFVILSAILSPIKLPIATAVFWITVFEVVLSVSPADYLRWSWSFWLHLPLMFSLIFLPILLTKDKSSQPFTNIRSLGWTE